MAEVLLFHHALGLTEGILAFADDLEQAGNSVNSPDLFEGRTFGTIPDGMAYVREVGFDEIMARGERAAQTLPAELVYIGFSLGVVPAQMLAQTRPGARGAIFLYSCVSPTEFGSPWPSKLPVQIHAMDRDPYFVDEGDIDAAREVVSAGEQAALFLYPGDQHYFADTSLASYRKEPSLLLMQRVLKFLHDLDG